MTASELRGRLANVPPDAKVFVMVHQLKPHLVDFIDAAWETWDKVEVSVVDYFADTNTVVILIGGI